MQALESRIDAVTVYRSGALITRSAALPSKVPDGPAELRLENLPLALDDASLRFAVQGEGDLPRVTDAAVTLEAGVGDPGLEPARDEALEAARLEQARRTAAVAQLRDELGRIEALTPSARPEPEEGQPPADSPNEARIALLELRAAQIRRVHAALADAEEALRLAGEQVAELEELRRRASTAREARSNELRKVVTLRLEGGAAASSGRLVVRYVVPGAQWTPSYALRLDEGLRQAKLEARAMVRQRSGEDWTGVRLTVSTATAQAWTELPELHSLRIGRRQPSPGRRWRPPPTGAGDLYADHDQAYGTPKSTRSPVGRASSRPAPPPPPQPAPEPMARMEQAPVSGGIAQPQYLAASAPPPSAPMPMASRAAAPKRRGRRKAKKAKLQWEGADAEMEMEMMADEMEAPHEAFGSNAYGGMAPPEPEPEPAQDLLRYGGLRMAAPDALERGRLAPQAAAAHPQVGKALRRAHKIERRPLPSRCQLPSTVGGFDFAIAAEHPADVRSDGAFHPVPLVAAEGSASPRYVCVPRESQDVFRRVVLDSPLAAPVLAGPADVYVAGDYLLTADLRHTPSKGRIKLGLGVEQAIKVARNVHFEEEKAGLIGGSIDLEHTITVKLANHLPEAVPVEVRERVPVPADAHDDDIHVTVGEVSPEWEEWEPDERPLQGGRRWRVKVPAGGERELEATWTVRIPKGHELVGGNRREV